MVRNLAKVSFCYQIKFGLVSSTFQPTGASAYIDQLANILMSYITQKDYEEKNPRILVKSEIHEILPSTSHLPTQLWFVKRSFQGTRAATPEALATWWQLIAIARTASKWPYLGGWFVGWNRFPANKQREKCDIRNPYKEYINPHYWGDEHPLYPYPYHICVSIWCFL